MGLFGRPINCPYCGKDLEDLSSKMKRVDICPSCDEKIYKSGSFYLPMFGEYLIFLGWEKPLSKKDKKTAIVVIALLVIGIVLACLGNIFGFLILLGIYPAYLLVGVVSLVKRKLKQKP